MQAAAPSCTELETIVLDWLGKMIGLPPQFLSRSPGSRGGGVIQTSASECVLDCLLAARAQAIRALKLKMGDKVEETVLLGKLMAYCSKVKLVCFLHISSVIIIVVGIHSCHVCISFRGMFIISGKGASFQ